jgi:hypothetical protein
MNTLEPSMYAHFRSLLDFYLSIVKSDFSSQTRSSGRVSLPIVSIDLLLALFRCGTDIFRLEPNVLTVPLPVIVLGDLHGNLFDLLRYLHEHGHPPATSYLFLGNIVDRGEFSTETLTVLILMKVLHAKHVFLIRGNHEFDEPCVSNTDFYNELAALYECDVVRVRIVDLFSFMPLAAVVGGFAFAAHGGVPADLVSLAQLEELRRPLSTFAGPLLEDLIWCPALSARPRAPLRHRRCGGVPEADGARNDHPQAPVDPLGPLDLAPAQGRDRLQRVLRRLRNIRRTTADRAGPCARGNAVRAEAADRTIGRRVRGNR